MKNTFFAAMLVAALGVVCAVSQSAEAFPYKLEPGIQVGVVGPHLYIDPDTQCQYFVMGPAATPRTYGDGRLVCDAKLVSDGAEMAPFAVLRDGFTGCNYLVWDEVYGEGVTHQLAPDGTWNCKPKSAPTAVNK